MRKQVESLGIMYLSHKPQDLWQWLVFQSHPHTSSNKDPHRRQSCILMSRESGRRMNWVCQSLLFVWMKRKAEAARMSPLCVWLCPRNKLTFALQKILWPSWTNSLIIVYLASLEFCPPLVFKCEVFTSAWWCRPALPRTKRLRQEDVRFKDCLRRRLSSRPIWVA